MAGGIFTEPVGQQVFNMEEAARREREEQESLLQERGTLPGFAPGPGPSAETKPPPGIRVAPDQVTAPSPARLAPATGGLGRKIRGVRHGLNKDIARFEGAQDELSQQRDQAYDDTAELRTLQGIETSRIRGQAMEQVAADREARAETMARLEEAEAEAASRLDESMLEAKYGAMDIGSIRHHQSVIESPYSTPDQKMRSQASLKSASEVDPNRLLGDTGNKITAVIAVSLGALGSAMTGGPNHALGIIQTAIDRDIQAQRELFAGKRAAVGESKLAWQIVNQRFDSEEEKAAAYEAMVWRQFNQKLENLQAEYSGPMEEARLTEMKVAAKQKEAEKLVDLQMMGADRSMKALSAEAAVRSQQMRAQAAMQSRGPMVEGLRPTGKTQISKKGLEAVKSRKAFSDSMKSEVKRAIQIRNDHAVGDLVGWTRAGKELTKIQKSLVQSLAKMSQAGALGDREREAFEEWTGKLTGPGFVVDDLEILLGQLDRGDAAFYRAQGFEEENNDPRGFQSAID